MLISDAVFTGNIFLEDTQILKMSHNYLVWLFEREWLPQVNVIEYLVPTGGTVWEKLESVAFLEEVCHWE